MHGFKSEHDGEPQSEPTKIGLKILINITQAVVEVCDVNNDGFIDFEEFKTLIMEAKAVYIEELFKTYDLNLDGFITQVEMRFQKIYLLTNDSNAGSLL